MVGSWLPPLIGDGLLTAMEKLPLLTFLPDLTVEELLFVLAVFLAAMCIMMNIHPTAILGATYLVAIIAFVDILGPSPMFVVVAVIAAAFVRVLAEQVISIKKDPQMTLTILTFIVDYIERRRNRE